MKPKLTLALAVLTLGLIVAAIVVSKRNIPSSDVDPGAPPSSHSVENRTGSPRSAESRRKPEDLEYEWKNYAADPSAEANDEKIHDYLRSIKSEGEFIEAVEFIGSLGFGKRRDLFLMSIFSNRNVPISLLFNQSRDFASPAESKLVQHAITSSLQKRDLTDFVFQGTKLSPTEMETFATGLGRAASNSKPFSDQSSEQAKASFEQGLMAFQHFEAGSPNSADLSLGKLHYLYSAAGTDFSRTLEEFEKIKIPGDHSYTQASVKLIGMLSQSQPENVIKFLSSSPNHSGEPELIRIAVDTWTRKNFDAAANWVDTGYANLSQLHKDQVAMAMAAAYKRNGDNRSADEWVAAIHDPKMKDIAQSQNK